MRAVTVAIAVALLVATAAADNFCNLNATSKTVVNLNTVQEFQGSADGYMVDISPCAKVNTTDCTEAYGTVTKARTVSCFKSKPTVTFDPLTNTTTLTFDSQVQSTLAMLMAGGVVRRLRTKYVCDPTAANVTNGGATYSPVNFQLTINFRTAAACPFVPTAAPTPAPQPIPHHDDDDDKKLSTWAIVGIIAGCVVAVVVVAFVCFKCRSSDSSAEGEYARV